MKSFRIPVRTLPENAVFWLLLLSIALGSAVSLYQKLADRAGEAPEYYYAAAPAASPVSAPVIPVKEFLEPVTLYPCMPDRFR